MTQHKLFSTLITISFYLDIVRSTLFYVYYKKQSLLFKLRTRMINVNSNYGKTTVCPLCLKSIDNQKHLIQSCEKLLIKDEAQIVYEDIFSNDIIKSIKIAELAHEKIQKRNNLLDKV